jgi:hypothetical protein
MKTWSRLSVLMGVISNQAEPLGPSRGLVKIATTGPRIVLEAWQVTGTVHGGVNEEAQKNKGCPENGNSRSHITRLNSSCWLVAKELQTIERHTQARRASKP